VGGCNGRLEEVRGHVPQRETFGCCCSLLTTAAVSPPCDRCDAGELADLAACSGGVSRKGDRPMDAVVNAGCLERVRP
jgi:hypothetical protein